MKVGAAQTYWQKNSSDVPTLIMKQVALLRQRFFWKSDGQA